MADISRCPLQACLPKLFFLSCTKSFRWSLWFNKKKSVFAAQGFPLLSGLQFSAV
jgi:hypothetical protein